AAAGVAGIVEAKLGDLGDGDVAQRLDRALLLVADVDDERGRFDRAVRGRAAARGLVAALILDPLGATHLHRLERVRRDRAAQLRAGEQQSAGARGDVVWSRQPAHVRLGAEEVAGDRPDAHSHHRIALAKARLLLIGDARPIAVGDLRAEVAEPSTHCTTDADADDRA